MNNMTLRELCQCYKISRRAVQGYEKLHLVQPSGKTEQGYLLYDEPTQQRIQLIHQYQTYGFHLKEIQELLSCSPLRLKNRLEEKLEELLQKQFREQEVLAELISMIEKL